MYSYCVRNTIVTAVSSLSLDFVGPPSSTTAPPVSLRTSTNTIPSECAVILPPGHAPSSTGTTEQCCEWYTVLANDTCLGVETRLNLDLGIIELLNPQVGSDCFLLLLEI